jgi:hypothetical protein
MGMRVASLVRRRGRISSHGRRTVLQARAKAESGAPSPGFRQWELRSGDRALVREFRNDSSAGAGVDVQLIENGELLLSKRCIRGDVARYVAEAFKNDHLRQGWTEVSADVS